MKLTLKFLLVFFALYITLPGFAQTKPKQTGKPPTQKEMEAIMKEAQIELEGLSEEDKKEMEKLGIKLPSFKDVPKIGNKTLADAFEDEMRVVPKKDAARIAAIPKNVTNVKMGSYIIAIQSKASANLKPETKNLIDKIYSYIRSNSKNNAEAGNIASGFWIAGKPEIAFYLLGKICSEDPANTDNLSNYASMLSMLGGQHLAIPVLNNLNSKFPKNSTLLNNLGQAWFGLGETAKAEKYLDSAIAIYAFHPQANMTKAAIEESRGNTEKARTALKKSIRHAYTKEKEEQLSRLGQKLSHNDFRLPRRSKADPMNLGGFSAPDFPLSVDASVLAEIQWREFYEQIDDKISLLQQLRELAYETALKEQEQRLNADKAKIKAAMANPGVEGNFISVPMYADRAIKKYKAYTDLYEKKLDAYLKKIGTFSTGERESLKNEYDQKIAELKKKDLEQTGEGLPNKDFCPQYKEASDKYLKAVNPTFWEFYTEALHLQKEFLNESAYWNMYMQWPDMFEVTKLDFQISWLSTLKKGLGLGGGSGHPFVSITKYACKKEEKKPEKTKLQKFEDVACQYKDTLDLIAMQIYSNCSKMTTKLNVKFIEYTRYDDFERSEGDTYTGSTVKVSVEKGFDALKISKGPLKIEAKVGASIEFEFDRVGVKDVTLSAEAKVGVGHNVLDDGLEESGSIGGKDIIDTTIEAGVEARISIISGKGSLSGTGKLSGLTLVEW